MRVKEWREKYKEIIGVYPEGLTKEGIMDAVAGTYLKPDTLYQQKVMTPEKLIDLSELTQQHILTSDEWGAQEKLNGLRAKLHLFVNGSRTDCRNRSELTALHVEKTDNFPSLKSFSLPNLEGTILDGEIRYLENPSLTVGGVVTEGSLSCAMALFSADADRAVEAQASQGFVNYTVYDIVRFKGQLIAASFKKRYELLQKVFTSYQRQFSAANINLVGLTLNKKELFERVCKEGGEGVILRHLNSNFYEPGKRVNSMLKWKKMYFYDVVISGYSKATKGRKFDGMIGALQVSAYNEKGEFVVVGKVPPGLDTARRKMSNSDGSLRKEMYGLVLEISCMGWTPKLLMYHTALERLRPDKGREECIIDFQPIKKQFERFKYMMS